MIERSYTFDASLHEFVPGNRPHAVRRAVGESDSGLKHLIKAASSGENHSSRGDRGLRKSSLSPLMRDSTETKDLRCWMTSNTAAIGQDLANPHRAQVTVVNVAQCAVHQDEDSLL